MLGAVSGRRGKSVVVGLLASGAVMVPIAFGIFDLARRYPTVRVSLTGGGALVFGFVTLVTKCSLVVVAGN